MSKTPFRSLFCVILSEAKNPGSFCELLGYSESARDLLFLCLSPLIFVSFRLLSLCHSERSEESRIFLDARRRMVVEGAIADTEKDPGFFAALRMTQK